MRDYREKIIKGCIMDGAFPTLLPRQCDVVVRITSDKAGQILSLQAYNIMIQIPLESVRDIIKATDK